MLRPNTKYAYIAPTYKQAKNIAWDILKEYCLKVDGTVFNESGLRVDFKNKSRITLYGADNPDSLRGMALWGVVFDEYSQQPSNIFSEIIRPALADNKGYGIWIGTPKGKNEFWRLYEHAKKDEEWEAILLTVGDTGLIPDKELSDAKKIMTNDEYLQEWYCSFESAIKGAYYANDFAKMRDEGRISAVPFLPQLEVHTWWDLGIGDYTTIGFFQLYGREPRLIDYYENHGLGLKHYVDILELKKKNLGYKFGTHNFPHDVEVRELGTGKSRKEVLESLGMKVKTVPNLDIADGINAVRIVLAQLWIDAVKCEKFIDAVSQYRQEWDEKRGCFKNTPLHDWTSHASDMLRYFAVSYDSLLNLQIKKAKVTYTPVYK
jgi:hypothetical protein